jgi:hypothetical protein
MTDSISRRERRPNDEPWPDLRTVWLEIEALPTWEDFSERFDRCFRHISCR